jgi:hypothetical protein
MGRPLLPPEFVRLPIGLLTARKAQGKRLPAGVLETWLDFRALAWGQDQTPELDFETLRQTTGKSRSTLCGHLAVLTDWFDLRWRISGDRVQVSFASAPNPESGTPEAPSINLIKESTSPLNESVGESQKLDSPPPRKAADPRSAHPAIQACRALCGRYPDKALYDRLIDILGPAPDLARLRRCRQEWLERGYNAASWKWVVEWYVTGIPQREHSGGKKHEARHPGRGAGQIDEPAAPSALAQRLAGRGGGERTDRQ